MTKPPIALGYYYNGSAQLLPEKIPFSLYTHIAHAFAEFDAKRMLVFPNEKETQAILRGAHRAKAKVVLAVGGAESGAAFLRAEPEALAEQLARHVKRVGYDGVDVDWEFPDAPGAPKALVVFVAALRRRLPKHTLTMAVPGSAWYGKHIETAALLPHIDLLNIMAYDFAGPWSDHADHNAPLSFSEAAIAYWTEQRKWPREKLLLGLPAYGRGFRAAKFGDPATGEHTHSSVSYRDIAALERAGWKRTLYAPAQAPMLVSPSGSEVLGFDDAESIGKKVAVAAKRGLAGYFFWQISEDTEDCTLGRAAKRAWKG